jgi:vanillate monooxygenase ferredoxin subunit
VPASTGPIAEPIITIAGVAATTRPVMSRRASVPNAKVCVKSITATNTEAATAKGASASLREGGTLRVGVPRNHFPLAEDAGHHLLLAGGIGITPMLSMAHGLAQRSASFTLHYSVRSKERAAFAEEITAAFPGQARLHFDDAVDSAMSLQPMLDGCAPTTHLYVCGPTGYIDWVLGAARAAGWPEPRLHREYFSAPAVSPGGRVAEAFEVQIRSSGLVVPVPADRSVVEVLRDRGIELPVSCEQGICGTCVIGIVDGTPDHRDMFLTPSEQAAGDRFTPCCSRARTPRLVLDL